MWPYRLGYTWGGEDTEKLGTSLRERTKLQKPQPAVRRARGQMGRKAVYVVTDITLLTNKSNMTCVSVSAHDTQKSGKRKLVQ